MTEHKTHRFDGGVWKTEIHDVDSTTELAVLCGCVDQKAIVQGINEALGRKVPMMFFGDKFGFIEGELSVSELAKVKAVLDNHKSPIHDAEAV